MPFKTKFIEENLVNYAYLNVQYMFSKKYFGCVNIFYNWIKRNSLKSFKSSQLEDMIISTTKIII